MILGTGVKCRHFLFLRLTKKKKQITRLIRLIDSAFQCYVLKPEYPPKSFSVRLMRQYPWSQLPRKGGNGEEEMNWTVLHPFAGYRRVYTRQHKIKWTGEENNINIIKTIFAGLPCLSAFTTRVGRGVVGTAELILGVVKFIPGKIQKQVFTPA